jgi:hypothetical protein
VTLTNGDSGGTTLASVEAQLKEANFWLRILAEPVLTDRLRKMIRTRNDRAIYQASLGGSTREVGKAAGVHHSTVESAWERWAAGGIVRVGNTPGRYVRLVDLDTVGVGLVTGE